jgi:monovalent cation:H+ antiporter-2, CPA2 family
MEYGIFEQVLTLIILSVIVIAVFRRLNLPSILGYLTIGIIVTVFGRRSFDEVYQYNLLAKYGVVFLLFTIGLEMSLPRLMTLKRIVFLLGTLQILVCGGAAWVVSRFFGVSPSNAFIFAAVFSMSSTALISKILSDTGEVQTHSGRMTIGVLIFQDIMVAPFLVIVSVLASNTGTHVWSEVTTELVIGLLTFVSLYVIGRLMITPLFKEIARARSNELFVLAALMVALAAAFFTDKVGMSKELGAFLAGVVLAGTPYHKQVAIDIRPFRDVLLGLFFIGIGMSLNIQTLPQTFGYILLIGSSMVLFKFIIIPLLIMLLKLGNKKQAFRTGLLLAQGGEFGFVLIAVATDFRLIRDIHAQIILGSIIFSMFVSLLCLQWYEPVLKKWGRRKPAKGALNQLKTPSKLKQHIVLCGFGYVGQQIAKLLREANVPYNALDLDASCVNQAALAGEPIYYGDAANRDILLSVGLLRATAVVICLDDAQAASDIFDVMKKESPKTPVIVRAKNTVAKQPFHDSMIARVVDEGIELGLLLGKELLIALGFKPEKIKKVLQTIKQQEEDEFFQGDALLDGEISNVAHLYAVKLAKTSVLCGQKIKSLALDKYKIKLHSLRPSGEPARKPAQHYQLKAKDVLVLFGQLDDIERFEQQML